MPDALDVAVAVTLFVAPGVLFLQGYRRGSSYTLPEKDLYALAEAVVASVAWLGLVWLLLILLGDPVKGWGLLPRDRRSLEDHRAAVAVLLLAVVLTPFVAGVLVGRAADALRRANWAQLTLAWTGVFEAPTAWDHAWSQAAKRAAEHQSWIDVRIQLKSGGVVEGRYGARSRVDLSPRPEKQVFLETGFAMTDDAEEPRILGDGTLGGVFVDASEIASVYFGS